MDSLRDETHRLLQLFEGCATDSAALEALVRSRLKTQLAFWDMRGLGGAAEAGARLAAGESVELALRSIRVMKRKELHPSMVTAEENALRWINTSGSSGYPLRYPISFEWRAAHHAVWTLAYRHMTDGVLEGYLDQRFQWAMARPPGGSVDGFSHLIECIPTGFGIVFSKPPDTVRPSVVHGAITTVVELLEDSRVWEWEPNWVILTYEQPEEFQVELIRRAWPSAEVHVEYAANDGGASAFTCSQGSMHFWTLRAYAQPVDGSLEVCDLWNSAVGFIRYQCGDLVEWDEGCACGFVFPIVSVRGRASGILRFADGRTLHRMCPFDTDELQGVRGVRVQVTGETAAVLDLVRERHCPTDEAALCRRLNALGLTSIQVRYHDSLSRIRRIGKFQTVVDRR